jgi:alcohol dehydrogenase class IV
MTVPSFRHATPALRTFCGDGALASLGRECDRLGLERVVILCGRSMSHQHADALADVESALASRLAGRFDRVAAHSPIPSVQAAATLLADVSADATVAVGGGSAIVTARAASIVLAEQRDIRELATSRGVDGRLVSPKLSAPKIASLVVPTTPTTAYAKAGSAVRDPETGDRLALYDPKSRAQSIFFDPKLALTAPSSLATGSALNTLSMAVEGLQSSTDDPLADALLAHALGIACEWLPRQVRDPADPEPRLRLMLAALLCGQGSDFAGGGLAQALSHAAGPRSNTSNGTVEAMLLPHTMRFNAPVVADRIANIARIIDLRAVPADATAESAVAGVGQVLREIGVPEHLRDVGVDQEALPEIVDHALDDWVLTQVPRPAGRDELLELLGEAW